MELNLDSNARCSSSYDLTASIVSYETDRTLLLKALQSLGMSTLKTKTMLVENGAADESRQVALQNGCQYRYLGRNVGYGAGHNVAMREMIGTSKYHLVLNPDVYFGRGVLESLFAFMEANPEVGLVMPKVLYPNGDLQRLCKLVPSPLDLILRRLDNDLISGPFHKLQNRYELRHMDTDAIQSVPVLSGCFMFVRCSVLQEVGGFDERFFMYLEDVDLCRRIRRFFDTVYFPEVSVFHSYQKGSYKDSTLFKYHLTSAIKYFCKWGWILDSERKAINNSALVLPIVDQKSSDSIPSRSSPSTA